MSILQKNCLLLCLSSRVMFTPVSLHQKMYAPMSHLIPITAPLFLFHEMFYSNISPTVNVCTYISRPVYVCSVISNSVYVARRPAGRPFLSSPQGLTWRGNTGESSRLGSLGLPPTTTTTTPPEADHPQSKPPRKGPKVRSRLRIARTTVLEVPPQQHKNVHLKGNRRGHRRRLPADPPKTPGRGRTAPHRTSGRGRSGQSAQGNPLPRTSKGLQT